MSDIPFENDNPFDMVLEAMREQYNLGIEDCIAHLRRQCAYRLALELEDLKIKDPDVGARS